MDPIQADLARYVEQGDRNALGHALDGLSREWRPLLRARFGDRLSEADQEDRLQQALVDLVLDPARPLPRVLAGADVLRVQTYRRAVFLNWLRDGWRKQTRRAHSDRAFGAGWSPEAEKEHWRRRDEQPPAIRPLPAAQQADGSEELTALIDARQTLVARLPGLAVRGRVLLALVARVDPRPFAAELATALGDSDAAVLRRMEAALQAPHDQLHEYLSAAMVEVVYPTGDLQQNLESARKALQRAMRDVRGSPAAERARVRRSGRRASFLPHAPSGAGDRP